MTPHKRAFPAKRKIEATAENASTPGGRFDSQLSSSPALPWRARISSRASSLLQALDQRPIHFAIIAILCSLLALGLGARWSAVEYFDDLFLDTYFHWRGPIAPAVIAEKLPQTKDIVLIETQYSVPRSLQAKLLKQLRLAKVVAFDFMFVDQEQQLDDEEKTAPWYQQSRREWKLENIELARAIRADNNVVLGTWPEEEKVPTGAAGHVALRHIWEKPPSLLWDSAHFQAHLEVEPGIDGVARHVRLLQKTSDKEPLTPSLGLAVAAAAMNLSREELQAAKIRDGFLFLGDRRIPVGEDGRMAIDYVGGRESFEYDTNRIVYRRVFDFDEPEDFRDKIVIIGESSFKSKEIFETPFGAMPGMQVHANIVATLLSSRGAPSTLARGYIALASFLGSLLLMLPLLRRPLWTGVFITLFLGAILIILGCLIFVHAHKILPPTIPFLAIILTYNAIALYEHRRARETLGRFIGREMVAPTLNVFSRLQLGGRVEEAAALFCDLRGYSSLSEHLLPEATGKLINEYTGALVKTVKKHGGRPIDYQGDGVFILFERSLAGAEYSWRAVQAALELQVDFENLRQKWNDESVTLPDAPIDIGIGIETGEMMIGLVGALEHLKPGAIGDAVNIASRIQRLNYQCGFPILITRTTYERIHEHLQAEITATDCGAFVIRGRETPIEVFGMGAPLSSRADSVDLDADGNLMQNNIS